MPALRFVFQDSFRCFFLFKRSQVRSRPFQKSTIYISFPPASDTSLPVAPVLISITDFVVHLETFLPKPLPLGWASSSRPMTHGTSFSSSPPSISSLAAPFLCSPTRRESLRLPTRSLSTV